MSDLESALQDAHRHVSDGYRLVGEQVARLARMPPDSDETQSAQALLDTMRSTLAIFVADLDRLEARCAEARRKP